MRAKQLAEARRVLVHLAHVLRRMELTEDDGVEIVAPAETRKNGTRTKAKVLSWQTFDGDAEVFQSIAAIVDKHAGTRVTASVDGNGLRAGEVHASSLLVLQLRQLVVDARRIPAEPAAAVTSDGIAFIPMRITTFDDFRRAFVETVGQSGHQVTLVGEALENKLTAAWDGIRSASAECDEAEVANSLAKATSARTQSVSGALAKRNGYSAARAREEFLEVEDDAGAIDAFLRAVGVPNLTLRKARQFLESLIVTPQVPARPKRVAATRTLSAKKKGKTTKKVQRTRKRPK